MVWFQLHEIQYLQTKGRMLVMRGCGKRGLSKNGLHQLIYFNA